jgi:O-antigen/teichoic acid export membrane protein
MGDVVAAALPTASQRVSGQAVWSVLAKVATLGGTLGVSIVAARYLGADDFGVWSLARNMVVYLGLLGAFGLDRALLRYVPELEAQGAGAGVRRLFILTVGVQALLASVAGALLVALRPLCERLLTPKIGPLLPLIAVLAAVFVFKETFYQLHFALGRARVLMITTTVTGAVWLTLTWWLLDEGWGAGGALAAQAGALGLACVMLLPSLQRAVRSLPTESPNGVRPRRLGGYAATMVGSGLVNLVVQRQSEVFFLAIVASPAVVGFYDLGYSLPQLGLELVPLSLYAVVLSAVTASYTRDPSRLGVLVGWYYKLLAVVTVPVALLGVVWADRALVLLYGAEMAPAGSVARIFSVVLLLPFVSVPVGTALLVKEQAHRTLPFGVLQLAVNIVLDLLLIPRFEIPGAIAAVVLSFVLVTPITIRYALRFTGPLEFPFRWIARLLVAVSPGLLPALARPWVHGWPAVATGVAASCVLMLVGFRLSGLIGAEERHRLETANLPGKRWLVRLLVRRV